MKINFNLIGNLKVKKKPSQELSKVDEGFTSIRVVCSVREECTRLVNQSKIYCSQNTVCVIGEPDDIVSLGS